MMVWLTERTGSEAEQQNAFVTTHSQCWNQAPEIDDATRTRKMIPAMKIAHEKIISNVYSIWYIDIII
jgi:hypothetical protein